MDAKNNLKKNEVDPGVVANEPLEVRQIMGFMHGQVTDSLEMLWVPLLCEQGVPAGQKAGRRTGRSCFRAYPPCRWN